MNGRLVSAEQRRMMHRAAARGGRIIAAKGTAEDYAWMLLEKYGFAREYRDGICTREMRLTPEGLALIANSATPKPEET